MPIQDGYNNHVRCVLPWREGIKGPLNIQLCCLSIWGLSIGKITMEGSQNLNVSNIICHLWKWRKPIYSHAWLWNRSEWVGMQICQPIMVTSLFVSYRQANKLWHKLARFIQQILLGMLLMYYEGGMGHRVFTSKHRLFSWGLDDELYPP